MLLCCILCDMIYDKLENIGVYVGADSEIARAVNYAKAFADEDGKYVIDGDKLFANVETYETSSESGKLFESHRKYIDVQIMLSGSEVHGVIPLDDDSLAVEKEYDPDTDLAFYSTISDHSRIVLSPGEFVIYFPQDCHKPGCAVDTPASVRKIVLKISV